MLKQLYAIIIAIKMTKYLQSPDIYIFFTIFIVVAFELASIMDTNSFMTAIIIMLANSLSAVTAHIIIS